MKRCTRFLAVCLCICTLLMTLSSCKGDKNITIRLPLSVFPSCFDPQISSGTDSESILNNCFEGLVRIDANGNIKNGVATDWKISTDGLTYTFTLRSDAQWFVPSSAEDILGEDYETTFDNRVTAHDFEFALKRVVAPDTRSPLANTLVSIENAESILAGRADPDTLGVTAINDTTLVIRLSKPGVNFLSVLASPACMPCNEEFFEATAGRYGLETGLILSNGPYYLRMMDSETGVSLYKNESYRGEYTAIADIVRFLFPSSMVQTSESDNEDTTSSAPKIIDLLTLEEGGFAAGSVTYTEAQSLESIAEIKKYNNAIKALCFNSSSYALSNANTRLAIIHATNTSVLRGDRPAADGIVPECCGLSPGVSYRSGNRLTNIPEYNLSTAGSYISKISGELSLSFICLKEDETLVKQILQDWQKVFGVSLSVTLTPCDTQAELDALIAAKTYDVAYTEIKTSEFIATDFLNRFSSGSSSNIIGLKSDSYDALIENAYNAPDEAAARTATVRAEEYLVSGGFILPIYADTSYLAVKDSAKGLSVRPSGTVYALYE